jgi:adenylate cyclase
MSPGARTRTFRLLMRIAISAISLVLFVAHISSSPRFEFIDRVENYMYDVRIRLTMPDTLDERVVIVDIDEASQAALGQWPWPRDTLATIVDNLFDVYGVQVLGFDALFAEAEESSAERLLARIESGDIGQIPGVREHLADLRVGMDSNSRFSESLIARDVVTGFVFKDSLAANEPEATGVLPEPVIRRGDLEGASVAFPRAQGFAGNLAEIQDNAAAGGFFDSPLIDADGVFRRTPLVQEYRGGIYPSLSLAVARIAKGSPPVGLLFAENSSGEMSGIDLEYLTLGDTAIPVNEQAAVYIPYRGRQGSFRYVSAKDVYAASLPAEYLEGKIVLLGASAAGLLDLRSTPVGQRYIGVEVHANMIGGLLDGNIRQQPSYAPGLELFLLLVVALMTILLLPRLSPLNALLFVALLLLAIAASNLWFWSSLKLIIPVASLLCYTLIASLLQINFGFFVEARNKRHISKVFGQYIPPSLVEEMDASGEEVSLEGEARDMSVLFSDVRGFTTLSEKLDAREMTHLMNEFLTPITGVIQQHRGTIDKYMGDAVMAFWGAPLPDENHAQHAVEAGLHMIEAVSNLEEAFAQKGWPPIAVGVGVSSGEMNVGNMGSEFRIAYTVMGDIVNLGSRLEGLTKEYGVDMIVSKGTVDRIKDIVVRELDLVRVKGKQEPVAIFEPLGPVSKVSQERRAATQEFGEAVSAYRQQEWGKAEEILYRLKDLNDELLYTVYLDRIASFKMDAPPPNWDGVFQHLSK